MAKSSIKFAIVILLACGVFTTFYLSRQYYRFHSGNLNAPSICTINDTVNCDAVIASPYSAIAGVPWSTLGLVFYTFLLIVAVAFFAKNADRQREALVVVSSLGFLGLLIDLPLAFILLTRIKVFCLFCFASYLINLLIFVLGRYAVDATVRALSFKGVLEVLTKGLLKKMPILAAVVAIALGVGLSWHWKKTYVAKPVVKNAELKDRLKDLVGRLPDKSATNFSLADSPQKGAPDAKIVFVEFSDFECPHCRLASNLFREAAGKFHDQIRIVFKNYPLDRSCNEKITRDMHQKACLFARAGYCSRLQPPKDLFWDMHDLFFDQGAMLDEAGVIAAAEKLGLDKKRFAACLKSPQSLAAVKRDLKLGDQLGVDSTPTVFMNGRLIPNYRLLQMDVLPTLIEVETERMASGQ